MNTDIEQYSPFTFLGRDIHSYIMRFLPLRDQVRLSMTCKTLQRNSRAQLLNATQGLPHLTDVLHHSPLFRKVHLSYQNIAHILNCTGAFLPKMLMNDHRCGWKLLAICGFEQELKDELKDEFSIVKDGYGYGVKEYFALGGQLRCLQRFLTIHHPNFTQAQNDPNGLLAIAAALGGHKVVLECLQQDYDYQLTMLTSEMTNTKLTLLSPALIRGKDDVIHYLLEQGVDPKIGENPAMIAAENGHWQWYEYFKKIRPIPTDAETAENLAGYMTKYGKLAEMEKFIEHCSFNAVALVGSAIMSNDKHIIDYFIEKGWIQYDQLAENGATFLHLIAAFGFLDLLISVIKDPRFPFSATTIDDEGHAAIHYAAMNGHWQVTEYLLKNYYQDCEIPTTQKGENLAHLAAKTAAVWYLKYLHQLYPKFFTQTDNEGSSVLHCVCIHPDSAPLRFLIDELDADIDVMNNRGQTPLHYRGYCIQLMRLNDAKPLWKVIADYVHNYQRYDLLNHQDIYDETLQMLIDDEENAEITKLFLPPTPAIIPNN